MNETAIGWTDYTWNLFSGCKKISEECKFCYAEHLSEKHRQGSEAKGKTSAAFPHGFDLTIRMKKLAEPARLFKSEGPSLIFCESMSDIGLDDAELTADERTRLHAADFENMNDLRRVFFNTIVATHQHRYQILTKRPATLLRYFRSRDPAVARRVLASCWIGVTIGHERSLSRLPDLLAFRDLGARVLFISAEPLLSDLVGAGLKLDGVDWLIAGGESGTHVHGSHQNFDRFLVSACHDHRGRGWLPKFDSEERVRRLRDEAARAGCAFFFKQWGGPKPDSAGRLLDGVEHDGMPSHVPGAMPERRAQIHAATAALSRKKPKAMPVMQ